MKNPIENTTNNIAKLREAIKESELDALMITSPVNRLYATGFSSSAGVALIAREGAWFFTDSRYIEAAALAISDAEISEQRSGSTYQKLVNAVCAERGLKTLGFEEKSITYSEYKTWEAGLDVALVPSQALLQDARAVKSRAELNKMIAAQRIAEKSFNEILPLIKTDITERRLANELLTAFLRNGADDKAFETIVVSGERSSMPHGVPEDRPLQKGFLTIDFGVKKDGWCSDTTRTVCLGRASEEMRRVYDTVLRAQLAGIAAARVGARGSDVHAAALNVISDAGFGKFFGHGFGHGLGLEVHETPNAAPSYAGELPAGAVISAEPGIYLPGKFGVRIEDVIYITESGSENITALPKELMEISV
ncbi:MAG: Xaa-Pro peptidase family protein [Oscillospiraceae bacterium]|jgi:Xaa-Pro aminopeptidase|nr:Xaa-Pro peptidase family protein [Oscillospiraceae bacterium]